MTMQVDLPPDLERSLRDGVEGGRFASVDDAIAEAVRMLLLSTPSEALPASTTEDEAITTNHRTIWEEFEEIIASIPDAEWAKLPPDGAEQHDHYIYGTPKRPTS